MTETATEWQPIETAPKTNDPILVVNSRHPENMRICVFENSRWVDGWEGGSWSFEVVLDPQPTHWMALPTFPRANPEGQA